MNFVASNEGYSIITVDATKDKLGIWWALIRHFVSEKMDLNLLRNPKNKLRVEARIKVSDAPKRVNLHLNSQRTTDFHSNLMEFDIPDTSNWHIINMTLHDFEVFPGDSIFGQMALMDWGLEKYEVKLDYFKVDIVNTDSSGTDLGSQIPYHPIVDNPEKFQNRIDVTHDCTIDLNYKDLNFNNWYEADESGKTNLLSVNGSQYAILRWDLEKYKNKKVKGSGLLELTTYSLQKSSDYSKDFGMIRVAEIIGGDPKWNQETVTFEKLCQDLPVKNIFNSQMIIDEEVKPLKGSQNLITISNPVLQRLINGNTLGLVIKPLGAVDASFYSMENRKLVPRLYFNLNE
jgi:hypothetical protein